jgi:hypothetical protein
LSSPGFSFSHGFPAGATTVEQYKFIVKTNAPSASDVTWSILNKTGSAVSASAVLEVQAYNGEFVLIRFDRQPEDDGDEAFVEYPFTLTIRGEYDNVTQDIDIEGFWVGYLI